MKRSKLDHFCPTLSVAVSRSDDAATLTAIEALFFRCRALVAIGTVCLDGLQYD